MNEYWSKFPIIRLLNPPVTALLRPVYLNESVEDMILAYDTQRTRAEIFSVSDQDNLKLALRLFCKEKQTNYKQGMNEVLAPFMLLVNNGVPFNTAFAAFKLFIDHIFPSIFTDSGACSLAGLCKIVNLLIKYLSPDIWTIFEVHGVSTEYFMASWILTIFSAKIQDFEQVFLLWEYMLRSNKRYILCIICVSLLEIHKNFIQEQGPGSLLVYLGSISLDSPSAIQDLICKSEEFLGYLPNSILTYLEAFDMCCPITVDQKLLAIEKFETFKVLPSEYLQELYPECFFKNRQKTISFVIIDIRLEQDQKNGYFTNSALFPLEYLADISKINSFINQFEGIKNFSHFVVMGESDIGIESCPIFFIKKMISEGFSFVSIAKGGFFEAHKFTDTKGLVPKRHNSDLCKWCLNLKRGSRKLSDYFLPGKKKRKETEGLNSEGELDYLNFTSWTI